MQRAKKVADPAGGPSAISRAEAVIKRMQGELRECLCEDVGKLTAIREAIGLAPTPQQIAQLYMRAHDLKGLGATCGYASVTTVAGQLCRIIDATADFASQAGLVDDHIDAIKALVRLDIRHPEHPKARQLIADLKRDLEDG
jgi:hypothetical protein